MPSPKLVPLLLSDDEREALGALARKRTASQSLGWINEWNKDPKPFVWTKSADEILETLAAYCQRIIDSAH
jgi:hypothetical protein